MNKKNIMKRILSGAMALVLLASPLTQIVSAAGDETVDVSVKKEWVGEAKDSATIILKQDDIEIDRIELNEANNWEHVFTGLPQEKTIEPMVERKSLFSEEELTKIQSTILDPTSDLEEIKNTVSQRIEGAVDLKGKQEGKTIDLTPEPLEFESKHRSPLVNSFIRLYLKHIGNIEYSIHDESVSKFRDAYNNPENNYNYNVVDEYIKKIETGEDTTRPEMNITDEMIYSFMYRIADPKFILSEAYWSLPELDLLEIGELKDATARFSSKEELIEDLSSALVDIGKGNAYNTEEDKAYIEEYIKEYRTIYVTRYHEMLDTEYGTIKEYLENYLPIREESAKLSYEIAKKEEAGEDVTADKAKQDELYAKMKQTPSILGTKLRTEQPASTYANLVSRDAIAEAFMNTLESLTHTVTTENEPVLYTYSVEEVPVEGYETTITQNPETGVWEITNTEIIEESEEESKEETIEETKEEESKEETIDETIKESVEEETVEEETVEEETFEEVVEETVTEEEETEAERVQVVIDKDGNVKETVVKTEKDIPDTGDKGIAAFLMAITLSAGILLAIRNKKEQKQL